MTEEQIKYYRNAAIQGTVEDEKNPLQLFNLTSTELLVGIVSGEVDPVFIAAMQLKDRGLNEAGKWIGFKD